MALDDLADRPYAPVDRDVLAGPDVVGQELDLGPGRGRGGRRHGCAASSIACVCVSL